MTMVSPEYKEPTWKKELNPELWAPILESAPEIPQSQASTKELLFL